MRIHKIDSSQVEDFFYLLAAPSPCIVFWQHDVVTASMHESFIDQDSL